MSRRERKATGLGAMRAQPRPRRAAPKPNTEYGKVIQLYAVEVLREAEERYDNLGLGAVGRDIVGWWDKGGGEIGKGAAAGSRQPSRGSTGSIAPTTATATETARGGVKQKGAKLGGVQSSSTAAATDRRRLPSRHELTSFWECLDSETRAQVLVIHKDALLRTVRCQYCRGMCLDAIALLAQVGGATYLCSSLSSLSLSLSNSLFFSLRLTLVSSSLSLSLSLSRHAFAGTTHGGGGTGGGRRSSCSWRQPIYNGLVS